jgi:hypothetical protein
MVVVGQSQGMDGHFDFKLAVCANIILAPKTGLWLAISFLVDGIYL